MIRNRYNYPTPPIRDIKPKGPLKACDVTFPADLITCSVSFFFFFFVFLCSFIIPFKDNTFSFHFLLFDLVILLIRLRCHTFWRLLMPTVRGDCGHLKTDNHSK